MDDFSAKQNVGPIFVKFTVYNAFIYLVLSRNPNNRHICNREGLSNKSMSKTKNKSSAFCMSEPKYKHFDSLDKSN